MTTVDPYELDCMAEVRLTNVDTTKVKEIILRVVANTGEILSQDASLKMGLAGTISKQTVLRHAIHRPDATSPSSATIYLFVLMQANYSSSVGDIDFRCLTVRG